MRIILMIGAVLIVGAAGLIALVLWRDEIHTDNLSRHVEPRLFWGSGVSAVTLSFTPQTSAICPAVRRAATVILLLDKSQSMRDNDAFEAALGAAARFVEEVDLTTTRVGVVFFDDQPFIAQPPTQDQQTLLQSLSGQTPVGTTNMAEALEVAQEMLDAVSGTAAAPLIILLTDGDANDPELALDIGRELGDAGIRIITIGTGLSDDRYLRELASVPADFYQANASPDLETIYNNLANELNNAAVFDVVLNEQLHEDTRLLPDSADPAAAINGNALTWEMASVTGEGTDFLYRVESGGMGLRHINAAAATVSYTDCIAGPLTASLGEGPQILVLPSLPLSILLCLLPLLPLLLLTWFRRPKPTPAPIPVVASQQEELPPPPDLTPAWMKRLDSSKVLVEASRVDHKDELTPTVIVGLGPVGRIVLPQIAQALYARYGSFPPDEIRLLQIDVQLKEKIAAESTLERPEHLAPHQWVLLEPDLVEVVGNLQRSPERWPYLKWFETTAPGYERSRGRLAIFYDLKDGSDRSILWQGLRQASRGLDKPRLRLVGSTFDDTSSGMLVDVARLLQIMTGRDEDVELWLTGPVGQDWSSRLHAPRQKVRAGDQQVRNLATLRELERFQRNARVPFHYVSSSNRQIELHDDANYAVVQTLFLFEPLNNKVTVEDHLMTITDSLLAVLNKPAQLRLNSLLKGSMSHASTLANRSGIGTVCALGAYSVRSPRGAVEEAIAWRMVLDLLFERRLGLVAAAALGEDGNYAPMDPDDFPDDVAARRKSAEAFVERYSGRLDNPDFRIILAHAISQILNGEQEGGEPTINRASGLLQAQRWLQSVRQLIAREGELEVARGLSVLEEQLLNWQEFLQQEVRPQVEQKLSEAQMALQALAGQTGRRWALPAGLDWETYRRNVRPWMTGSPTKNTADEPLLRVAQRFGWHLDYDKSVGRWRLQLLAPPGEFTWVDYAVDLDSLAVERTAATVLNTVLEQVRPLAQQATAGNMVMDEAEKLSPQLWLDQAELRLTFNHQLASDYMQGNTNEYVLLVAPESQRTKLLAEKLQETPRKPDIQLCETTDETAITVLRVRDHLPLEAYSGYQAEVWAAQMVPPELYVWRGEQEAARMEGGESRMSPRFVGWLERDKALLDLFAEAYLLDLLAHYGTLFELPGLGEWQGAGIGEALENLLGKEREKHPESFRVPRQRERALDELAQAIEAQRQALWQEPGKHTFLRQAAEARVQPLSQSRDRREVDLANYLYALIAEY